MKRTTPLLSITSFFFNDTATTEIYTLSLHDALPIFSPFVTPVHPPNSTNLPRNVSNVLACQPRAVIGPVAVAHVDRKSTRLNSSHQIISYAVFCLKKKQKLQIDEPMSCQPTTQVRRD